MSEINQVLCSDDDDLVSNAIVKAKEIAKSCWKMILVYSRYGLLWACDGYPYVPDGERVNIVARVYPGGRIELRRHLKGGKE